MNLTNTLFHHQIPFTCFLHSTNKTSCPSFLFQHPKHSSSSSSSFHVKLSSSKTAIQKTYNFQDDEEEEEFEEDDEDDEDIFVPLSKMRQWSRNKPKGFGEGKVYDTSLEDKLLQELEQTRLPKDGNLNSPKPKEKEPQEDGIIRVRLVNLPKKKKIHKDLQAAFKPFTGITNIIPAVSGNQKTRDPVCKGFAFVHFKSHKDANRFVDIISTQPITFGKVQKQIRCEIMRPSPPVKDSTESPPLPVPETPLDPCVAFDMLKTGDDDLVSATDDDNDNGNRFGNVVEQKHEAEVSSESSKEQKAVVVREKGKKKTVRAKKETPKRSIPGSANRLKMKEKALLSGVFSKYGGISSD